MTDTTIWIVAFEPAAHRTDGGVGGWDWNLDLAQIERLFDAYADEDSNVYMFQWTTDLDLTTEAGRETLITENDDTFSDPGSVEGFALRKHIPDNERLPLWDVPFPTISVQNGQGADWDTFASYITITTDCAYLVTLHTGEQFTGVLVSYDADRTAALPAEFDVMDDAGNIIRKRVVSLTRIKSLEVL
jgi:hypothetical protein